MALIGLLSVIDGIEWFWMRGLWLNMQLMLDFLKAPFLVLRVSYYTSLTFLMIFSNFVIYADNTIVHSKFDQASDLWQQLKLASKLESDLRDTADCCRKWLVGLNA